MHTNSPQISVLDTSAGGQLQPQAQINDATLVDIMRQRALLQPTRLAYKFLKYTTSGCSERDWTYQDVDRQARLIAVALTELGAFQKPVLLLFHSGLEYIAALYGCFYAGAIAVPAYPPRRSHGTDRIGTILEDARPSVILTTSALQANIQEWLNSFAHSAESVVIATDTLDEALAEAWQQPTLARNALAFLQYTSGSTANPKGVMVSYGNLMHNLKLIQHCSQTSENDVGISWLPIYHDLGLIACVLQAAYAGLPLNFMDPVQFLQFPMRWLHAITRYRGTATCSPNFAFEECIRRVKPQDLASLDLSSWRIAINGAEPIRPETLERFFEVFSACGFRRETHRPSYGLAEATLLVTSGVLDSPLVAFDRQALAKNKVVVVPEHSTDGQRLIGCGGMVLDQNIAIVRPEDGTRCMADEIGEIWVQSESVTQGYWQNQDATQEVFGARLSDSDEGPFMRTGDLGFFYQENLYITGRIKDIIILNGRNHYPQDIERTAEKSHPSIIQGACVAFSIDRASGEQLVIMVEINPRYRWPTDLAGTTKPGSLPDIQAIVRRSVAEAHDIRVHEVVLLLMGEILKTSSGKIQRRACRAKYLAGDLNRWSGY